MKAIKKKKKEKKDEECPHLLQDKLLVFPHWYSKESYFHLKQLASFELKIWIFNFNALDLV